MSPTFLIDAAKKPTSPTVNSSRCVVFGVNTPTSVTSNSFPVAIIRTLSPTFTVPFTTRIYAITPRYGSYKESKIIHCNGSSESPVGAGTFSTICSKISSIPIPAFAEASTASDASNPITSSTSWRTRSGSALGKSILLITGKISKLLSSAKYTFANVCASIPCAASTTRIAPSQAAKLRDTSYVKSTCPGVSIK
ncbi:Uncharacterised protein [Streptococcus pneumoniae]|nr:Uncharacterised protein [Streptococcus pneumoniae]